MKVIQTFSFAPFTRKNNTSFGGFPYEKLFWYATAASMALARKHYGRVELYTDSTGGQLIKDIGLKYDAVHVLLDDLPEIAKPMWAYPKLLVYSLQKEPFIHLDTDALAWRPFPPRFVESPVFGQSFEVQGEQRRFYARLLELMRKHLKFLPKSYFEFPLDFSQFYPINCGIIGGSDLDLITGYAKESMQIITDPANAQGWEAAQAEYGGPLDHFNCAVEQINIQLWCKSRGIEIATLYTPEQELASQQGTYNLQYTHFVGPSKKLHQNLFLLDEFLFKEMPKTRAMVDSFFRKREEKLPKKEPIARAVQTYFFDEDFGPNITGGFPEQRYFLYCWWLSLFALRRSFPEVHFYSNLPESSFPFGELGFEYSGVHQIEPEDSGRFFNVMKFETYLAQTEPFFYSDLDAYATPYFPGRIRSAEIAVESAEFLAEMKASYKGGIQALRQFLKLSPLDFSVIPESLLNVDPLNCGLLGGKNLTLLHQYASACLKTIRAEENRTGWDQVEAAGEMRGALVAIEQIFIPKLLEAKKIVPELMITPGRTVPEMKKYRYLHLFGANKRDEKLLARVENDIQKADPEVKAKIDEYCKK